MTALSVPRQPKRLRSICVFGSAATGHNPIIAVAARRLGQEMALNAIRLVYGGGASGLVGAVAKGAASCNGNVVAIPHKSQADDIWHSFGVEQVVTVADGHIRKRLMFDYADAFVVLPGGVDTIDAMAEVLAWRQTEQHRKPLVIANLTGLWTPWLKLVEHLEISGFAAEGTTKGLLVADDISEILPMLRDAIAQPDGTSWGPYKVSIEEAGGCFSSPNP
ncbi:MAG TPA: TIGR00730 family Rossman fold protein [Hyphomicrobiaceae bacterium]|nr:TIGR00730 family Rossman fold protein [Hyphomicrobiaceae bacterium]